MSTTVMTLANLLAQTAAPVGGPQNLLSSPMLPIIVVLIIFMLFSFNSKRKTDKDRQKLLDSMKRGDRIQTIGGILGTIVEVREHEVVVKVDEGNNTKIKFSRSAISRVVSEEDKVEAKS